MGLSFEGTQLAFDFPVATDVGPSLAASNGQLYAAWKGSNGDERIWWSRTTDGKKWDPQQSMDDPIRTAFRPSLVDFYGQLYAAWKGGGDDERLWYSSFNGATWKLPKCFHTEFAESPL